MTDGDADKVVIQAIVFGMTEGGPGPEGTIWPKHTMDPQEAQFRAKQVIERLRKAGYEIQRTD